MCATETSCFATLQTSFHPLSTGPGLLAVDGRQLAHGLPARLIPLNELAVLLLHPSTLPSVERAVVNELVQRATQERGKWVIALAGLLLPGLRRIAATVGAISDRPVGEVEADVLEQFRAALAQPQTDVAEFAASVLQAARCDRPGQHAHHPPLPARSCWRHTP